MLSNTANEICTVAHYSNERQIAERKQRNYFYKVGITEVDQTIENLVQKCVTDGYIKQVCPIYVANINFYCDETAITCLFSRAHSEDDLRPTYFDLCEKFKKDVNAFCDPLTPISLFISNKKLHVLFEIKTVIEHPEDKLEEDNYNPRKITIKLTTTVEVPERQAQVLMLSEKLVITHSSYESSSIGCSLTDVDVNEDIPF